MRRRIAEEDDEHDEEGCGTHDAPHSQLPQNRHGGVAATNGTVSSQHTRRRRYHQHQNRWHRRRKSNNISGSLLTERVGAASLTVFVVTLLGIALLYGGKTNSSVNVRLRRGNSQYTLQQQHNNNQHGFRIDTPNAPPCTEHLAPSSISFTLVTQLSYERIWMVGKHCVRWGYDHHISLAVFTNQTLSNVTSSIIAQGCRMEQLTMSLLNSNDYDEEDYPVNTLRNLALSKVRTTHIMYVDIDFWPSTTLYPILQSSVLRTEMASDPRLAIVVPAFQLYAHRLCGADEKCKEKEQTNDVPSTMADLLRLMQTEDVAPFDLEANWNGHGSTSYKTFVLQEAGELFDLPCVNSNRYEPYLALRYCRDLPPFQEAFTGYGKNKMTWAMQLRRSGYDLSQLGGAFVCHFPHFRSKAKLSWDYIPDFNVTDALAVSVEARKEKKQNRFNNVEKKDMIRGVDWTQTRRGKGDLLFLDYRRWLYDTVPDQSRLKLCDETYTDDSKLWVN